MIENKNHWEKVYSTKTPEEVSWTQQKPETSLALIRKSKIPKTANIIDIGGGDSKLVDWLLDEGYTNITVLDISGKALEKAKNRLGVKASKVTWIESNILDFKPVQHYDLWHDRAAFHFLTKPDDILKYQSVLNQCFVKHLVVGTFSEKGPLKCSGLEINQYSAEGLSKVFSKYDLQEFLMEDHQTPFNTIQNFVFCSFNKKRD